jgi:hypothetical protein
MDLRCPKCGWPHLKAAFLVHQEGLQHVKSRRCLFGFMFSSGGPTPFIGQGTTRGVQQTELSRIVRPPTKWSYARLVVRSAFVTFAAIVSYVVYVAASTPPVSTVPMKLYVFGAPIVFLFLAFSVWRHNCVEYPRQFAKWERSFVCQRCGAVSVHDPLSP